MNDFHLYNPVKVVFGKDALNDLPEILRPYNSILLLYSENIIKEIGLYEKLLGLLDNKTIVEFNEITSNPSYESCMKCVDMLQEKPVDLILAVGGGSVIDAGKFISAATLYKNGDPWDMLAKEAPIQDTIPISVVLTLAATGSEMNCNSVMSRNSTQEKLAFSHPKLFSIASFLDPTITYSLPKGQTVNGVIDSFVHILEQYLAVNSDTDLQDRFAEGVLKTIIQHGATVLDDPENYEARSALMWSASMALNGIITAGTNGDWAAHMIGHELTSLYGMVHGISVGIAMPALLTALKKQKHSRLVMYAKNVWNLSNQSEEALVEEAINQTREFFESLAGRPLTLSEFSIPEEADELIAKRFEDRGWIMGELQNIDPKMVKQILSLCR